MILMFQMCFDLSKMRPASCHGCGCQILIIVMDDSSDGSDMSVMEVDSRSAKNLTENNVFPGCYSDTQRVWTDVDASVLQSISVIFLRNKKKSEPRAPQSRRSKSP